ncbi:hypothetical protein GCM10011403_27730 [Pseudohongiella nitratireducens]|jgi:hypothetical protein|uniref:Uncharacterized protein n=1 Tax=Pseudohongiella nitratireducens TaxID=1768907 RepID=A0A916QM35_9GAMM|nr:hypothetical protein GCM10011403_27730 [Pseudohongiella nitratireducens]
MKRLLQTASPDFKSLDLQGDAGMALLHTTQEMTSTSKAYPLYKEVIAYGLSKAASGP